MSNWIVQPPNFVRWLFFKSLWRLPQGKKQVCLTFDDGPVPEQTPWVVETLARYNIHATFFCVGENVNKYPEVFELLKRNGHCIGNHTYNHMQLFHNSWNTYLDNIKKCNDAEGGATFFRAPHGQITPWRIRQLRRQFKNVVFWDVLPMDYDQKLTPEQVFNNLRRHVRDGSIINFHDSIKAGERMRYALSHAVEYLLNEGYTFVNLPDVIK